jgi:flagellin-specific chaperone FliS
MLNTRYPTVGASQNNSAPGMPFGASANAARSYRQNSVATADPRQQILIVYDRAIAGCHQQDIELAGRAITELVKGLNMDAGPIAGNLLSIYQYCSTLIRKGQFKSVASMLQELRDTWAAVSM